MSDTSDHSEGAAAIEQEIQTALRPLGGFPKERPKLISTGRTASAMAAVDEQHDLDQFAIEALVDQALHARIVGVRGKYLPGARDAFVRKTLLAWIMTVGADNAGGPLS
jgi:hypothetical protein